MKPVIQSFHAQADIKVATAYYEHEADTQTAIDFIDTLEEAVKHISLWPASGSLRFAELLGLRGVRSYSLRRFPYIIFYIEHLDHIDIWRVLHGHRDIAATLRDENDI